MLLLTLSQEPLRLGEARTDVPVYKGRIWTLAFSPDGTLPRGARQVKEALRRLDRR